MGHVATGGGGQAGGALAVVVSERDWGRAGGETEEGATRGRDSGDETGQAGRAVDHQKIRTREAIENLQSIFGSELINIWNL